VPVKRLGDVFGECTGRIEGPRVYLKLDTQGYDLKVLEGSTECLDHIFALQAELSVKPIYDGMPSYLEALSTLTQLGFEMSGVYPVNRDEQLRVIELDCVMVRAAAARHG
jgi:hypothetical protein